MSITEYLSSNNNHRKLILCTITLICFFPLISIKKYSPMRQVRFHMGDYLVYSSKCKIPNLNPYDPLAMQFYKPLNYTGCSKFALLTYVTKNENIATLHINTTAALSYTPNKISCYYAYFKRRQNKDNPDDYLEFSHYKFFDKNVTILDDFVLVVCKDRKTKMKIYNNTHAAIVIKNDLKKQIAKLDNDVNNKPFSVLLVGVDSISRLNLIRTLPSTFKFLEERKWISLKGYNKVGDNTFPNLMAMLTGMNESLAFEKCNLSEVNRLKNCLFIWDTFKNLSYITGFAEDEATINTFNYFRKGFINAPTDYYFRPYILGSELLSTGDKIQRLHYCSGPETSGERILNLAKDFAITFKNYPNFGLFWTNSFSHSNINSPARMDGKIKKFLEDIESSGVLENSFVIFMSDHGFRFGPIRYNHMGWLEERLPFMYISIPKRFQNQYPQEFENFKAKANTLTTPYDIHMTLQHILVLSGFNNYIMRPTSGCQHCYSLLSEVSLDRSCEDVAVEQHWCTCENYKPISKDNPTVKEAADYLIMQLHKIIEVQGGDEICINYSVRRIINAMVSETLNYRNKDTYLLIVIKTRPRAVFEATLSMKRDTNGNTFHVSGNISRLDLYFYTSKCTEDPYLKKYCYCKFY